MAKLQYLIFKNLGPTQNLDLSHLNKFIIKKSVKYEDLRTVLQMFHPGMSVFSFDLKSAYHHIDICEEHRKCLSFK